MSVAELSIRRPVSTVMLFVSLLVIGLIAALRLPLELMPQANMPFIMVAMPYPGSTPEEVERNLTRPAEEALATMSGIQQLGSRSSAEASTVFIQFSDWTRDVAIAASEARERLDAARDSLPDDLRRYFVRSWSTADQAVIDILVESDGDLLSQSELIDRFIKRRLERLPGVARVEVEGLPRQEVEIALDPDRVQAHGLRLESVVSALQASSFAMTAGQITDGPRRLRLQPQGEIADLAQYRDMVLSRGGVRLSDVADVSLRPQRMTTTRLRDGRPSVVIDIYKEPSANVVQLSRAVRAELARIMQEPRLSGIRARVDDDAGQMVTSSLLALAEAGAIGLVLSVIVLYAFLRHWPSTLMVTTAIPICFVITLGFMYFFGVTLNILSMMGLLLAIGMLVDNAVVVVESIYQERERMPDQPVLASIVGTRHVSIALSAGTLCHCVVFLPMLFGERNIIAVYLSQIAITISVSLLASWLVAVSLIPMLSARMRTPAAVHARDGVVGRLQRRYARVLRWTLEHRGWTVLGILLVIAVSIVPMRLTKSDMMNEDDPAEVPIFYQWNGAYTQAQMGEEVARVEAYLRENRERLRIEGVASRYSEQGWARTQVQLQEMDPKSARAIADSISKELPESARARLGVGNQGGMGGEPTGAGFSLTGDSTHTLAEIAHDILPMLEARPELRDVRVDTGDRNSELSVRVDRERAAAFGFTTQEVAGFVNMALRGTSLRDMRREDAQVPVNVRFAGAEKASIADLQGFMVRAADGRSVPLMAMVDAQVSPTATDISRRNRQTTLDIQANLEGGTTQPEAMEAIKQVMAGVALPPGYGHTFEGGGFGMELDAGRQMAVSTGLGLVMIFIIMAMVFESLLFPLAILSGVVFSIFGVYWLFWLTGTEFNIMAAIGILVLMGVVVNNGIVMVEHINNLRRRGMSRTDALVEGSRERLRPVLMTMGTAILAMIPIALSNTQIAGSEGPPYYPMARAIAGGLAFSTVVTLLFLPTIYALLDDLRAGSARLLGRARMTRAQRAQERVPAAG